MTWLKNHLRDKFLAGAQCRLAMSRPAPEPLHLE
jgi:hypothetical protein